MENELNDMNQPLNMEEGILLLYLQKRYEGAHFMGLREYFLNTLPHSKELFLPTLTALSMKRRTTSRLHENALWMDITDEGTRALNSNPSPLFGNY